MLLATLKRSISDIVLHLSSIMISRLFQEVITNSIQNKGLPTPHVQHVLEVHKQTDKNKHMLESIV